MIVNRLNNLYLLVVFVDNFFLRCFCYDLDLSILINVSGECFGLIDYL